MRNEKFFNKFFSLAILTLFALVITACVPKAPMEREANLSIEPPKGKAGASIKIRGSNFLPEEKVEIVMTVGEVHHLLGTEKVEIIVSDKNGSFVVNSGIPVKTPPGVYKVIASGDKGSRGIFNLEVIK